MSRRDPVAYVVAIKGSHLTLNLQDAHKWHFSAHPDGVTPVTEVGGLIGVDGGTRLIVVRVRSLSFAEPSEAHRAGVGSTSLKEEPLRNLEGIVVGTITRRNDGLYFGPDSLASPSLQSFSMFANKGWLTKEDGGGLDKPVLGVR